MTRRFVVALALCASLVVGGIVVLHASGRTLCDCSPYSLWDWEYWWYGCNEPPPPECGQVG